MKILAVSDVPSRSLEHLVAHHPERLGDVGLIVSCGDLHRGYLEFLVDGLNRELLFVYGNHKLDEDSDRSFSDAVADGFWDRIRPYRDTARARVAGSVDLHGRMAVFGDYLIAGFGGTLWYNGRRNQFQEHEMARIVRRVERRVRWHRLQEKITGMRRRDLIVISHAPAKGVHDQPDRCHTGFQCFRDFIRRAAPALWLHGHVHLAGGAQQQVSRVDKTTVVNVFGCKLVTLGEKSIDISSRCDAHVKI